VPSRADVDILHTLFKELARIRYGDESDWAKVSNYQKVSSYFTTGAVGAFANTLNKRNPMKADKIKIHPKYIRHAKSVGAIYGGLLKCYGDRGWTITS